MKLKVNQRAGAFFELFAASGANLRITAELMKDLVDDFTDIEMKARRIQEREHEGDQLTHDIITRLNTTFITPMDREDIYALGTALDDVVDAMEAAADVFVLHAIERPLPVMQAQVDVLCRAARQTEEALNQLSKMGKVNLEPYWIEINSLENEGDRIYRRAVADLFSGDYRAMDVLRWKEVIESLEEAIDGLENVANVVESIVLKHA
jgi:predicted phosphate transport protein (TIGR00153 family)